MLIAAASHSSAGVYNCKSFPRGATQKQKMPFGVVWCPWNIRLTLV